MKNYKNIFSSEDCPPLKTFTQYIEDKLQKRDRFLFEKHLIDCSKCSDVLEGMISYDTVEDFENELRTLNILIHKNKKKNNRTWIMAVAASVSLIIFSYVIFALKENANNSSQTNISLKEETMKEDNTRSQPDTLAGQVGVTHNDDKLINKEKSTDKMLSFNSAEEKIIEPEEIQVNKPAPSSASRNLNIVMEEDIALVEEVVVTGYGTQKKASISGAVSAVKDSTISKSLKSKNNSSGITEDLTPALKLMNTHLKNERYDSVMVEADKFLLRHPEQEDVLWLKALALLGKNNIDEAKNILDSLAVGSKKYGNKSKNKLKKIK